MKNQTILTSLVLLLTLAIFNLTTMGQDYKLVETGQIECYDDDGNVIDCPPEGEALYGQDAQFIGNIFSFTDNGDGTVTDLNTGLMWQQVPSSDDFRWQQAVDYCDALVLNGYEDWRMPSAKELFSISNFTSGWPYLDLNYFDLASGQVTKDEQYWSSDYYVGVTVEGGSNAAFGVNHVTGHIKAYAANSGGPVGGKYVRAVRGNTYGMNALFDNGDGTITDNATGLMWKQNDNDEGIDWEAALSYAYNSEFAGHNDWRLPNVKELQSIVDYSYSPTATNPDNIGPAINPMFNCTQIINEAGNDDYAYYWTNTSAHFTSGEPYYCAWYVAFGTAVNGEGLDFHGAGAVRFDTKYEGGPLGEGGERYYNFVRLVRDASASGTGELNKTENNLDIFPNPAYNQITVNLPNGISGTSTIQIDNLPGDVVYMENKDLAQNAIIDISKLKPGIYILTLQNGGEVYSKKFVKQ